MFFFSWTPPPNSQFSGANSHSFLPTKYFFNIINLKIFSTLKIFHLSFSGGHQQLPLLCNVYLLARKIQSGRLPFRTSSYQQWRVVLFVGRSCFRVRQEWSPAAAAAKVFLGNCCVWRKINCSRWWFHLHSRILKWREKKKTWRHRFE